MSAQVHERTQTGGDDGRPLKILLLDDMETDRQRLRRLCRRAGLTFLADDASTLAEFGDALDRAEYDIVFLDYALGFGTGLDAQEILSAHDNQAGAISIMVSTIDDLDLALKSMRMGCADYINKEELSVEAIRKSLALAFERRLLISSLNEEQTAREEMRSLVLRIARTCGVEIRTVIASTLEQVRTVGASDTGVDATDLSESLQQLNQLQSMQNALLNELGETGTVGLDRVIGPRRVEIEKA